MKSNKNLLTKKKISKILSNSGLNILLSSFLLNIKKKKDLAIVSPVGETEELKNFAKYLKDSGISEIADAIFVYKKGLKFVPLDINALHIKEKIPLGTSSAFFSGTYLAYCLGYDIIVVTDTDAFLSSKKSFIECVHTARKENKVVLPVSTALEDANPNKTGGYNVNQFAFYPRKVFEKVGFHTPYSWKGGEDYELNRRLIKAGLVYLNKDVFVSHPRAGYTIFHKMIEKKKFYPYVSGLMKTFLLLGTTSIFYYLKFVLWYIFYAFFADIFSDQELLKTLENTPYFLAYYPADVKEEKFEIKKIKKTGIYPYSSLLRFLMTPILLASLLISKKATIYTDEITLKTSRLSIVFGLLKATVLVPLRLLQAFSALFVGRKTVKTLVYPVKPENAKKAIEIFGRLIKKNGM